MDIEVGLDTLALPYPEQRGLHHAAAELGFGRIWTAGGQDPFQVCALRWRDALDVSNHGIGTGIGVATVHSRSPLAMATSARMLTNLTEGQFILGLGAGSSYSHEFRRTWGIEEKSALKLVEAYLKAVRGFLAGDSVTYLEAGLTYRDARLAGDPALTPLYVGALGQRMLQLAGALADGVVLSWSTASGVEWAREQLAIAAKSTNRETTVRIATNVRICVDEDVAVARRALAAALYPYVAPTLGSPAPSVYRPSMERAGFGSALRELDALVDLSLARDQLLDSFPEELLQGLGYYGPAEGARAALLRHAGNADAAIVRVVAARGDASSALQVMQACRP